jgi:sugar lactone lactonase YvrE
MKNIFHHVLKRRSIGVGAILVLVLSLGFVMTTRGDGRVIQTIAGTGEPGHSGDGGRALNARITASQGIAVDAAGNVYVAEYAGHVVRKIDATGMISTVAGVADKAGFNGDNQPAARAMLAAPSDVAIGPDASLYIIDKGNNRIRRVNSSGVISTVVGNGQQGFSGDNGSAVQAKLNLPSAIAFDAAGNMYIADTGNHRVRRVAGGVITTIAGNGSFGYSGDGGPALQAKFKSINDVAVSPSGDVYVADSLNNRIRKISNGTVSTVVGTGSFNIASLSQLGDGKAASAAIVRWPFAIAFDNAGNLYVAEHGSNRIRRVGTNGTISTVVGSGDPRVGGSTGDGGPADRAQLFGPSGVVVDAAGNVYVSDSRNFRVRKINAQ